MEIKELKAQLKAKKVELRQAKLEAKTTYKAAIAKIKADTTVKTLKEKILATRKAVKAAKMKKKPVAKKPANSGNKKN